MLKLERLSLRFGGVEALSGLSLEIAENSLYGLIGPNGSGKTTLFNVVSGLYRPHGGRVWLGSENITGRKPYAIVRLGVARTFQNPRLFERMSVFDNVQAARHSLPGTQGRESVEGLLGQAGLIQRRDELAKNLPLPEQRRLELVRAVARSPRLLLLDEPAGGMTPAETAQMAELISEVAAPGRTCVLIEHKINMIEALCERVCVLNFGRKIAEGRPREVFKEPAVLDAYLGREHA